MDKIISIVLNDNENTAYKVGEYVGNLHQIHSIDRDTLLGGILFEVWVVDGDNGQLVKKFSIPYHSILLIGWG